MFQNVQVSLKTYNGSRLIELSKVAIEKSPVLKRNAYTVKNAEAELQIQEVKENTFIVINLSGEQCGTINRNQILKNKKTNPEIRISEIMNTNVQSITAEMPLIHAYYTLMQGIDLLLVIKNNELIGFVDQDSVNAATS